MSSTTSWTSPWRLIWGCTGAWDFETLLLLCSLRNSNRPRFRKLIYTWGVRLFFFQKNNLSCSRWFVHIFRYLPQILTIWMFSTHVLDTCHSKLLDLVIFFNHYIMHDKYLQSTLYLMIPYHFPSHSLSPSPLDLDEIHIFRSFGIFCCRDVGHLCISSATQTDGPTSSTPYHLSEIT